MNLSPAPGEKLSLRSGLVTAFLLGTAFILIFFFIATFLEPLMPRVIDPNAPIGSWEVCQFTAKGQLYVLRPIDAHHREPFSVSGEPLRDQLPARPLEKEGESIHLSAPRVQFYEQFQPEPLVAHERMLFSNRGSGFEYWHLIKHTDPKTHGYFVGYQAENGRFLGYMGQNGLQQNRPSVNESIPLLNAPRTIIAPLVTPGTYPTRSLPTAVENESSWDYQLEVGRRIWLATPEGIWQCHLGDRSVKPFASIENVLGLQFYSDSNKRTLSILAACSQGLRLFDETGRELSRADFSWPQSQVDRHQIIASREVALTQTNELILIEPETPKAKESSQITTISWFERSGKLAKQTKETMHLYEFADTNRPTEPIISATYALESLLGGLGFTSNILLHFNEGAPFIPSRFAPYFWINVALTLTLVVILWWRQLQLGTPLTHSLTWTLFLSLFGAAGFFGYLFQKPWVPAMRCETCGRRRLSEQALCPHCGQPLQKPKPLGTEIFQADPHLVLAQTG